MTEARAAQARGAWPRVQAGASVAAGRPMNDNNRNHIFKLIILFYYYYYYYYYY